MAPPAVDTLSVDWFNQLPPTYRSLYLARRVGRGAPDGQPPGAPPRWLHVATRGPALTPDDLPRVHAALPPATHLPAASPAAATTPPTTDTIMQLEALASMEAVGLARVAAQDFITKDNAFKAGPTLCRLADDDVKVVSRCWSGGAIGGIDGVPLPVGAARDIRRRRKTSLKGINVVRGGLCGINPKDKKVILAVVRKAVVDSFFIGHSFCRQSSGDVVKAAADVEAACPTLARAQRNWAACALLARAFRHRNEAESRKAKDKVLELAAASAAAYKTPMAAEVATPERHYTIVDDDQDAASGRGSDRDGAEDNDGEEDFLPCL